MNYINVVFFYIFKQMYLNLCGLEKRQNNFYLYIHNCYNILFVYSFFIHYISTVTIVLLYLIIYACYILKCVSASK